MNVHRHGCGQTHPALAGTPLERGFRKRPAESPLPRGVARSDGVCVSTVGRHEIFRLARTSLDSSHGPDRLQEVDYSND